jgi:hypothetical protein
MFYGISNEHDVIDGYDTMLTTARPALGRTQPPGIGIGYFLGVKCLGLGVDHSPHSSTKVKERVELCLFYFSGPSWPVLT